VTMSVLRLRSGTCGSGIRTAEIRIFGLRTSARLPSHRASVLANTTRSPR
jgi:hypothetical protein